MAEKARRINTPVERAGDRPVEGHGHLRGGRGFPGGDGPKHTELRRRIGDQPGGRGQDDAQAERMWEGHGSKIASGRRASYRALEARCSYIGRAT